MAVASKDSYTNSKFTGVGPSKSRVSKLSYALGIGAKRSVAMILALDLCRLIFCVQLGESPGCPCVLFAF